MSYLIQFLQQVLTWLGNEFLYVFKWLWHELLTALAAVLSGIPVPAWLAGAAAAFSAVPPGVAFFLNAFEVPAGISIILGAYTIRFVIRRVPLIG
jgi:hypothetical protein